MGSKKAGQYTPQSSLGELGQSLLKFITPVRKAKAHTKVLDYLENAKLEEAAIGNAGAAKAGATTTTPQTDAKSASKTTAPVATTGMIKVSRDGSGTPWINVVMNLMTACDQGSAHARGYQASNAYQSAQENRAELRRKTVGLIVNLVTEDSAEETEESNATAPKLEASAAHEKPQKKQVDHFKAASQQNVLKKPA